MDYNKLFDMVVSDIPLKPEPACFGITFIAPPGAGKSTIANIISQKTGLYITANDKIRRLVESVGIDPNEPENRRLVEQLANDRTVYMLKNKTSMIIDANMQFFYESAMNNFKNHDARLFFVKIDCPEEEILKRIESRAANFDKKPENFSRAVAADYYKYLERTKTSTFTDDLVLFTIDSSKSLENIEKQVDELIDVLNNKLKGEN